MLPGMLISLQMFLSMLLPRPAISQFLIVVQQMLVIFGL